MTLLAVSNYLFTVPNISQFCSLPSAKQERSENHQHVSFKVEKSSFEITAETLLQLRVGAELSGSEAKPRFCKILVKYRRHSRYTFVIPFHYASHPPYVSPCSAKP
ncbi:hypothetical protein HN011_007469 [Eciton burchellii]|nr:hypothetical protein HN011_007469 [Eciton burchellii]